jgi:hypothetical protein
LRKSLPILLRLLSIAALLCCWGSSLHQSAATRTGSSSIAGAWKGESICVAYRPACKDEVVVYLFEEIPDKPDRLMMYADKIIDGQRVPIYKQEFQLERGTGTLSGEFTKRQTHGLWEYTVSGDTMEGTLVILPDRTLARRIKVKRVSPDQVPAPPAREMYDGS